MRFRLHFLAALSLLASGGTLCAQQYPIMEKVAAKVIQKYQTSTCEQLWASRGKPKPPAEQRIVQLLRDDPNMRQAFFDRVAGPIANKMFECGMVP